MFPEWVSAFYDHSLPPSFPSSPVHDPRMGLALTALADRPSTFSTLSDDDVGTAVYAGPALDGGSDCILYEAGQRLGTFEEMRKEALYVDLNQQEATEKLSAGIDEPAAKGKDSSRWEDIKVRVIWCDLTAWVMPWGIQALYRELEDSKTNGQVRVGKVDIMRMRGANHYVRVSHSVLTCVTRC